MTDDRVETHIVDRRRRRAVGAAGGALPGVLGAAARRGARPARWCRSASTQRPPAPACWRRSRMPTWCSCRPRTRSCRSARSSACPASATRCARPPRRSSASPPSSPAATCAAWPPSCSPRSASRSAPPGWPSTTAPAAAGGVLDGWLVDTADADDVARVRAAGHRLPRRAADDDRPRRHRRDGRTPRSRWPPSERTLSRAARGRLTCLPVDGIGEVDRGGRPRRAARRARSTLQDGDVLVVTSKVVSKAEGRVRTGEREDGARPTRPTAPSPGAGARRSSAPGTAW